MSPRPSSVMAWSASFPRVSGDEPKRFTEGKVTLPFSPRERG